MDTEADFKDFVRTASRDYRPNVSIDCVIFGYHAAELKVLLVRNTLVTKWCLPGGYIRKDENLDQAAARITEDRTGITNLFLQQFRAFGNPDRKHAESIDLKKLTAMVGKDFPIPEWISNPTITIGYYAITDIIHAKPAPDMLSSECAWFPVKKLPPLGFDHKDLVREALATLRMQLYHFPIGKNLLPSKFTLREIKEFYEVMSGKALNASNFPNKLIAIGLIKKTAEKRKIGAHRAPTCYTFNTRVYEKALRDGLVLA